MFEIIFIIAVSLYFIQSVLFIIGVNKKFTKIFGEKLPSITVIVAARNEQNNIKECLSSLSNLVYPKEKMEILILDDNSMDNTAQIIKEFIADKPVFKYLFVEEKIGSLKGKTNALAYGIKRATGEIILTTDADCSVSPEWAETLASYYTENVAVVCGFTNQYDDTAFKGMQSIDFLYLLFVAGGAMNLGKPLSCIGNNMSYKKSAYDEVGGYEALDFSITEDFNLLMAINKLKRYKIIYPLDRKGLVTSKPCPDIKTLYWQKKRWGRGGIKSEPVGYSVFISGIAAHLCICLMPFFFSVLSLYLLVLKLGIDLFVLKPLHTKLGLKFSFKNFIAFEFYYIIYVVLLPIAVLLKKDIKWKGRVFD